MIILSLQAPLTYADNGTLENAQEKTSSADADAPTPDTKEQKTPSSDHNKKEESTNEYQGLWGLSIGMGYALITKAPKGKYFSDSAGDVSSNFRIAHDADSGRAWYFTARYLPVYAHAKIDESWYRTMIQFFNLGAMFVQPLSNSWSLNSSLEASSILVRFRRSDASTESTHTGAFNFGGTFGLGADWLAQEHLSVGPRLYATFGNIQLVQFSIAASLFL